MAAKLNQIIAIEKGVKSRSYGELTELNKAIQKPDLFVGFNRTYQKRDDDDSDLPAERKKVQVSVDDVLTRTELVLTELMDLTARKDWTNCVARANVVVDGKELLTMVPVPHLLFLEKQLVDMRTFVGNLPVLDESDLWNYDTSSGLFKSDETKTTRTKKISKPIVLYPATEQHPAQTQMVTEDVVAGTWSMVKHSGATPKPHRDEIAKRVEKLLHAVKQAREAANMQEETATPPVGARVFNYLLRGETV